MVSILWLDVDPVQDRARAKLGTHPEKPQILLLTELIYKATALLRMPILDIQYK